MSGTKNQEKRICILYVMWHKNMIDRNARNRLAEEIRHFVAGISDNYRFDDSIFSLVTEDRGVIDVRDQMWFTYDDIRRHKMKGKWKLSEEDLKKVSRFILFLKTDMEYRWPQYPLKNPILRLLFWLLTLGILPKRINRKWEKSGNYEVWPFYSSEEYKTALSNPKYLAGTT